MPFDVFISHSSADKEIAFALCAGLEKAGLRCWIAPRNVVGGMDYADQLSQAIQECPATLLVFTKHSNESRHVKAEIDAAFGSSKILMPLRIGEVQPTMGMAHYLRNTHWLSAEGMPSEEQTSHVAETLKSLIAGSTPPPAPPPSKSAPVSAGKSGVSPVLIGVIVLVLAALGVGVFFLLPKSESKPTAKTEEPAEMAETESETEESETPAGFDTPEFKQVAGAFADAWIAMGLVDQANSAFDKTEWDEQRAKALAKAFLKIGNREAAMNALSFGAAPTKVEEYEMAALEARAGAVKQALETLRNAEKTGPLEGSPAPADTRIAILERASTESAALGLEKAVIDQLLTEADAFAAKDKETLAGNLQRLRLARIRALTGDSEGAKATLEKEVEELPESVDADYAPVVAEVFRVYLALKDLPGAEAFCEELTFASDTDVAVQPLIQGLIDGKKFTEAENLAFSGENPESQRLVVQGYIKEGEIEAAAKAAEGKHASGIALPVLVAIAFQGAEDPDNYKLWMDKARAIALKDSSKIGQAKGLAEIARIEAEAGFADSAEKTMTEAKALVGLKE